jgi:putative SOS response-associated peptidase YedK
MCGRYTLQATPEELARQFSAEIDDPSLFKPRYNIAPSQHVAAVRLKPDTAKRELVQLRWGLIPSWAKDPKIAYSTINAKAETVATKPAFRSAFRKRRCLIPASGFYEWQQQGKQKQPMYIRLHDRHLFAFAGLWERWEPKDGEPIESCTIVTTEANEFMQRIHHRMPVILTPEDYEVWLDSAVQQLEGLQYLLGPSPDLLRPYPAVEMEAYAVSKMVNNPRNDILQCVEPI